MPAHVTAEFDFYRFFNNNSIIARGTKIVRWRRISSFVNTKWRTAPKNIATNSQNRMNANYSLERFYNQNSGDVRIIHFFLKLTGASYATGIQFTSVAWQTQFAVFFIWFVPLIAEQINCYHILQKINIRALFCPRWHPLSIVTAAALCHNSKFNPKPEQKLSQNICNSNGKQIETTHTGIPFPPLPNPLTTRTRRPWSDAIVSIFLSQYRCPKMFRHRPNDVVTFHTKHPSSFVFAIVYVSFFVDGHAAVFTPTFPAARAVTDQRRDFLLLIQSWTRSICLSLGWSNGSFNYNCSLIVGSGEAA